jgi:hypothetical protein
MKNIDIVIRKKTEHCSQICIVSPREVFKFNHEYKLNKKTNQYITKIEFISGT